MKHIYYLKDSQQKDTKSFILLGELDKIALDINKSNDFEEYELDSKFYSAFNSLYIQSKNDNFYWQYCQLSVYVANFDTLKTLFFDAYPDATFENFIQSELNKLSGCIKIDDEYRIDGQFIYENAASKISLDFFDCNPLMQSITFTQQRKLEFLQTKMEELKQPIGQTNPVESIKVSDDEQIDCELDIVDNSIGTNATKLAMLYELGIMDYLKNNKLQPNVSDLKLSKLISIITGTKQATICRIITDTNGIGNGKNKLKEKDYENARSEIRKIELTLR